MPFPRLAGSSLLWWLVIPLGATVAACLLASRLPDVKSRVLLGALVGVLLSSLANVIWYERYVDFPILLALAALALAAGVTLRRSDRERWLLAGVIAIASLFWLL